MPYSSDYSKIRLQNPAIFSIDHPDDWDKYSYGNVNQARSSFGPAVRKLGPGSDVDPDIIRITLWPKERKVRMD